MPFRQAVCNYPEYANKGKHADVLLLTPASVKFLTSQQFPSET